MVQVEGLNLEGLSNGAHFCCIRARSFQGDKSCLLPDRNKCERKISDSWN